MSPEQVTEVIRQALFIALQISAPLLILVMTIGFGISLFQSVTGIHEIALAFVPKLIVFAVTLIIFFPWILRTLTRYTTSIFVTQWENIINLSYLH